MNETTVAPKARTKAAVASAFEVRRFHEFRAALDFAGVEAVAK